MKQSKKYTLTLDSNTEKDYIEKMKKIKFLLILIGILFIANLMQAQNDTYKIGSTEYYIGKYYSTTGKPMVKRSYANKKAFLKSKGYDKVPDGYEIDHITPLSEGGTDDPSNMQLLTVEEHARKTAKERANRSSNSSSPKYYSNTANSTPSGTYKGKTVYTGKNGGRYYINSNGNKTYIKSNTSTSNKPSSSTYNYSAPSSSGRTIYTGPRGGKYYINSNGNKTYLKKN